MRKISAGFFVIGIFIFLNLLTSSCGVMNNSQPITEYELLLKNSRLKKDSTFKSPTVDERSPIAEDARQKFHGLKYFPVNEQLIMSAVLVRAIDAQAFEMKTSTDRLPVYRKFGDLMFNFEGTDFSLEIYQNVDLITRDGYEDYLFLPFTDETSGEECYGGGRYFDLKIPDGDTLVVDFNYAYNPYCNYSSNYSCPVPPPQNHIPIRIEAGELNYH